MARPDTEHIPFITVYVTRQPEDHQDGIMDTLPVALFANGSVALVVAKDLIVPITDTQMEQIIDLRDEAMEMFYATRALAA